MNGVTEEEFFSLCNYLNSSLTRKYEDQKKGFNETRDELNEIYIMSAVNEILETKGIETNDEEMRTVYNNVYEASLEIKKQADIVSQKKDLLDEAKKKKNQELIDKAKEEYLLARKPLIIAYRQAVVATNGMMRIVRKGLEM